MYVVLKTESIWQVLRLYLLVYEARHPVLGGSVKASSTLQNDITLLNINIQEPNPLANELRFEKGVVEDV